MKNDLKMTPCMIIRRGHYLYFFKYWIYSVFMDMSIFGMRLDKTIFNSDEGAYPVQCISYQYIHELEKYIELLPDDVFVDVGCAWGRLIGYLEQKYRIKKYIGIELNEAVAEKAKQFFAKKPNISIIEGNILDNIPTDATVFYLFNPFDSEVLRKFLTKLREIHGESAKRIRLYYLHPVHIDVFEEFPEWKLIKTDTLQPANMGTINLSCLSSIFKEDL